MATPWTAACQASLSITNSQSLLKFMSIVSVMPSNHLILCHPLFPPSFFTSIRVFSNESVLCIRWPKYYSFSFSTSPSNEYSGLISFRINYQLSSVAQSCPTLCDPIDCSTAGLPVHHHSWSLFTFMSIVSVTPSNHLILCCLSPSPPAFNLSQHQGLF